MKARFPHRHQGGSTPEYDSVPSLESLRSSPVYGEDRACCCPGRPVVRVIMPPTAARPYPVDLLLCGHHYRVCREKLAARGTDIYDLPGRADAATAALLRDPRPRAEVTQ